MCEPHAPRFTSDRVESNVSNAPMSDTVKTFCDVPTVLGARTCNAAPWELSTSQSAGTSKAMPQALSVYVRRPASGA